MNLRSFLILALITATVATGACRGAPSGGPSPASPPSGSSDRSAPSTKPTTLQEIANYNGPDRQQLLEEGARQEGKMMLYTTGLLAQATRPLLDAYMDKYPFVKAEVYRADEQDLVQKTQQEYRAGRYEVDVLEANISTFFVPIQAGLVEKFWSPHLEKIEKDAKDSSGFLAGVRETYAGVGYNTDLISKEDAPKTYQDLLNPRWKGQMAIAGSSTGARWVGALVLTFGEDFVQRIAQQDIRVQNVSARAIADLVIAGEVPLSPTVFDSHVSTSKEKGAPIEWLPVEPVLVNAGSVALAKKAPHPHAAMLYIDFLLSQEGQRIYVDRGYGSPRTDMGGRGTYKKIYIELQSKDYVKEFEGWQRMVRNLFVRG